jgi:hypothetical protein
MIVVVFTAVALYALLPHALTTLRIRTKLMSIAAVHVCNAVTVPRVKSMLTARAYSAVKVFAWQQRATMV